MQKIILLLVFLSILFFPKTSYAQGTPWSGACISITDPTIPTIQGFECLFTNILKIITTVAGLAFLIMFIVGGFQYMQSKNDSKAVATASSTLTYAIIGLIGVIISWLIILAIDNFTGIKVTEFEIPQ